MHYVKETDRQPRHHLPRTTSAVVKCVCGFPEKAPIFKHKVKLNNIFSLSIVHSFQAKKTKPKSGLQENSTIPLDILVSKYCKVLTLFCIELTIILHTDLAQCTVTVVTEEGIILHCVLIWMSHCCFICTFHSPINMSAPTS